MPEIFKEVGMSGEPKGLTCPGAKSENQKFPFTPLRHDFFAQRIKITPLVKI